MRHYHWSCHEFGSLNRKVPRIEQSLTVSVAHEAHSCFDTEVVPPYTPLVMLDDLQQHMHTLCRCSPREAERRGYFPGTMVETAGMHDGHRTAALALGLGRVPGYPTVAEDNRSHVLQVRQDIEDEGLDNRFGRAMGALVGVRPSSRAY